MCVFDAAFSQGHSLIQELDGNSCLVAVWSDYFTKNIPGVFALNIIFHASDESYEVKVMWRFKFGNIV